MLRRILALVFLGVVIAVKAVIWNRLLAMRRGDRPPEPLRMLVVVDAPIEAAWRVLADIPLQPLWMHEMKEVRLTTPGPARVGTRASLDREAA